MRNFYRQHFSDCIRSFWDALIFLLIVCSITACMPSTSPRWMSTASVLSTNTPHSATPISTTTLPPACSSEEIYLALGAMEFAAGGQTNQIWRTSLDAGSAKLIYQAPRLLSIAGNDMLLPATVQEIREHFEADPKYPDRRYPDIESLSVYVSLDYLALSPDERSLAWAEHYTWCPGNYCYGEARIKVLQIDSGNMVIDRRANLGVTSLAWTPDSQTLVFSELLEISGDETYNLKRLDVRTGETAHIGSGDEPAVSPDGQRLVAIDRDPYIVSGLDLMSLNGYDRKTVASPIWTFINTPTWSPDGLHIAFAGSTVNEPTASRISIYTLDLQTLEVVTFTPSVDIRFFDDLRWSPDGNLIAADAGEDFSDWNHLIILDIQSGQVINDFVERRNTLPSWEWSDDGECILFAKGFEPDTKNEITIFHISTGNLITLSMPEAIRDDYYDGTVFLSDITW